MKAGQSPLLATIVTSDDTVILLKNQQNVKYFVCDLQNQFLYYEGIKVNIYASLGSNFQGVNIHKTNAPIQTAMFYI